MAAIVISGIVAFIGAIIQTTMGFGGAVILINVLPLFFPITKAVALVQGSVVIINIVYMIIYWKKIRWDVLRPALIPGVLISLVFTFVSVSVDMKVLTIALGVLFISLSVYYLAVVDRIHMVPSKTNGVLMGSFSGLTNAFFGLAGPPVALYLAPSLDDKLEYFASAQCFFLSSSVACISVRIASGVYEVSDLPMLGYLMAVFMAGALIGVRILKKLDSNVLKKFIYGFIGLNGVYIIVKELIAG